MQFFGYVCAFAVVVGIGACGNGGTARPDGGSGYDFDADILPMYPDTGTRYDSAVPVDSSVARKAIRLSTGTPPQDFWPSKSAYETACGAMNVDDIRKTNPLLPGMNAAQSACSAQTSAFNYAVGIGLLTYSNNTATIACFDATTVSSFDVTLQQLKDQLPAEAQADVLFSSYGGRVAADSYCQKKNSAWTGFGPYAANGDATSGKVVCVKGHGTRMEAALPACDVTMACHADSFECANAINTYCKGKGFAAGYGMFGWNPNTKKGAIFCFNEET